MLFFFSWMVLASGKKIWKLIHSFVRVCQRLTSLCGGELPHTPFKHISSDSSEIIAVNATLGVAGLPQSGTSQTAIFTGINGAKKFGRHFGPHPPSVLRSLIADKNIFHQLKAIGKSVEFANAFPQAFFDYIDSGIRRLTVTTLSCRLAGVSLLTAQKLQRDEGISADFVRARWQELGHPDIKPIKSIEAGRHLANIATRHDFTLFEYWLTDHAGHSQEMSFAVEVLERFDEFLSGFLESFNPRNTCWSLSVIMVTLRIFLQNCIHAIVCHAFLPASIGISLPNG